MCDSQEITLLPLLRPLQVHLNPSAAFRARAGLVGLHGLRLSERHIELIGVVFGVSAPGALDARILTITGIRVSTQGL
jgi:hypothetical protein